MGYTSVLAVRTVLDPAAPESSTATAASLPDAAIASSIASAQTEVDALLRSRYPVPFGDGRVPPLIADITTALAAYLVDLTFRKGLDYESDRDPVLLRYRRAHDLLTELATGRAALDAGPDAPGTGGLVGFPINRYDGDLFGPSAFALRTRGRRAEFAEEGRPDG